MERILFLKAQGNISFDDHTVKYISSFTGYLFSKGSRWFWIIFCSALVALFAVFVIPEDSFPFIYIRYFFGSLLVLFLPGFAFLKSLFYHQDLGHVERFALSTISCQSNFINVVIDGIT